MYQVTVIFTQHTPEGKCNSLELLKIIESIQPDVIFEVIGYVAYDYLYVQQNRTKLESDAVKWYLTTHTADHLPVDTFNSPDDYHSKWNMLLNTTGKYLKTSESLNHAFNQMVFHAQTGGFPFLNSDEHDALFDALDAEENKILAELGDENLNQIAVLRNEVNSNRDEVMIDNIYRYASEQSFESGVFLIGAGHRRSIKKKLDKIAPRYGAQINWHFL